MGSFKTLSGIELKQEYGSEDLLNGEPCAVGKAGTYPYTRGIHASMYRGRLWTMRQYAGFGTAEETNERYHYLLSQGTTGLSVAFDLPTQMGRDSDHKLAEGEVGRVGVAVSTLEDMELLFKEIPLDHISVSMTINATAAAILAFYLAVAEKRKIPWSSLRGTVQNDILKEYIARGTYIYPPEPSLKLTSDIFEFCSKEVPHWNTISVSGYHIREAGSTAVQEIAFTLADGIQYVESAVSRGLKVDDFAPRVAFFFNCHNDFLEEIAKFRAARRMWAKIMRDRFRAKNPKSMMLRFHTQTAGSSLTAQEPLNNITRTTIQALAAVLGGTQSLHTNSFDEALGLPTEESAVIALKTQQIIAYESGAANSVDPMGGSYLIESLTDEIERRAWEIILKVDTLGGMVKAIEKGYPQSEIETAAYEYQKQIECGDRTVVGVNRFCQSGEHVFDTLRINPKGEQQQKKRIRSCRSRRSKEEVSEALAGLRKTAEKGGNLMYPILECARRKATIGEISDAMRDVFGQHDL